MATLVLQGAGAVLGSALGPAGSAFGRAAGALVGNAIDRSLLGEDRVTEGSRLTDLQVQESREGAPIPLVFGRARLSGQVIWATEFEEVIDEEEQQQAGKGGGPTVTTRTFSYFGNFAVALCEGTISHIGRIWADGELLDTNNVILRVYPGDDTQQPDSLIVSKQGAGKAPAYRGTAYVVFERLPLADYGNRLPQLSFEVVRAIGKLEQDVRAVQLIPGASEFVYDTKPVLEENANPLFSSHNRHISHAPTDFEASIDELMAICPNLENVALVSTWFGSDLRCGACSIVPKVETQFRNLDLDTDWRVGNLTRFDAELVSQIDDAPAFGGSPSDQGIIRCIQFLKLRGLKVTFNPFVMMDIAANNRLPDPYTPDGVGQPIYPWRGRITSSIASGLSGSPDKTAMAREEIERFLGTAARDEFSVSNSQLRFSGDDNRGYRHFILHSAHLCAVAGGVDAFLLGSEMRSLTQLRDNQGHHPFVDGMIALARDVRAILGPQTVITYGADWSEYFGYHPQDGSGDVLFHLDSLWADRDIDVIGIDNYMPLADWRDGASHLDATRASTPYDAVYLDQNIKGGEGFDWFYASFDDRLAQRRTPITDDAHNKPWVFRYKDLINWWQNPHFNRHNGIEAAQPTAWQPQSKPIMFTELGFPAIDKAANQPNVFFDSRSSEGAIPYFSAATRDDNAQRASLEAIHNHWDKLQNNPISPVYGGPMVDMSRCYLWAWDVRPFPLFPQQGAIWSDSENWRFGHWLTGRLGAAPLAQLLEGIVKRYVNLDIDVSGVHDTVDGYVISDRVSARNALDTLLEFFQIDILERSGRLIAMPRQRIADSNVYIDELAVIADTPEVTRQREHSDEIPSALSLAYQDIDVDFRAVSCSSRRLTGESLRIRDAQLPIVSSYDRVLPVVEQSLRALWLERDRFSFALPQSRLDIEVGDILNIHDNDGVALAVVTRLEDGIERRLQARKVTGVHRLSASSNTPSRQLANQLPAAILPPTVVVMDLPVFDDEARAYAPKIAVNANHWTGGAPIGFSNSGAGFQIRQTLTRPAFIGSLISPLEGGPIGVFDHATKLDIDLPRGALSSIEDNALFGGGNVLAVQSRGGAWELLQYANAQLINPKQWRLSRLLRAQLGTEDALASGFEVGARVVIINGAVETLAINRSEADRSVVLKVGLLNRDFTDDFATCFNAVPKRRGLLPLAPGHLSASRVIETDDVVLGWIRRTRIDGDVWEAVDVPLGEASERYQVIIRNDVQPLRTITVETNSLIYSRQQQLEDFGILPTRLSFSVAQISASEGPGVERAGSFSLIP